MAMKYVAFSFALAIDSFGAPSIMAITRASHALLRGIAQEDEEHTKRRKSIGWFKYAYVLEFPVVASVYRTMAQS